MLLAFTSRAEWHTVQRLKRDPVGAGRGFDADNASRFVGGMADRFAALTSPLTRTEPTDDELRCGSGNSVRRRSSDI
eukprot:6459953-Amphidinium_carterae.1